MKEIKVLKLESYDSNLPLPSYESLEAVGADIRANLGEGKVKEITPGERTLIPTGLVFEIPKGFEIQVRPRSGLSLKTGLMVVNSPGTIDSDYRGEIKIIIGNLGRDIETIRHGDRIAQLVFSPVHQCSFVESGELLKTARGAGGFGSTGVS